MGYQDLSMCTMYLHRVPWSTLRILHFCPAADESGRVPRPSMILSFLVSLQLLFCPINGRTVSFRLIRCIAPVHTRFMYVIYMNFISQLLIRSGLLRLFISAELRRASNVLEMIFCNKWSAQCMRTYKDTCMPPLSARCWLPLL